ncbi:hypothetical protein [Streptomyces fumanus]|uniref:hypothetical protein n=1 Tax=Streptomyces fumanus TaxID=67302 RepID=UPI003F4CD38E
MTALEVRALPPEALLGADAALDYALCLVLSSMGAAHIVQGLFSLGQDITAEGWQVARRTGRRTGVGAGL